MQRWVICVFFAVACEIAAAQAFDEAAMKVRLDQVASSHSGKNAFMGTVLVARRDRILLNKGYGMANLEWEIPNAPEIPSRYAEGLGKDQGGRFAGPHVRHPGSY